MPATLPVFDPAAMAGTHRRSGLSPSSAEPSSLQVWFQESQPDEVAKAKSNFSTWLQRISESEATFQRHVYDNPNLTELDLIQHRGRIYSMLAYGEDLNVSFWMLGAAKKIDPSNYFKLIQEQIGHLMAILNAWHGPLEAQEDVPEDFKQGVREIEEGKLVDLDTALTAAPKALDL
jgi:hypothetical protein